MTMDRPPTAFKRTCLQLRHKLMYVDERHQVLGYVDDCAHLRQ